LSWLFGFTTRKVTALPDEKHQASQALRDKAGGEKLEPENNPLGSLG